MSRSSEVPGIAAATLIDPVSPELVLVDPALAAHERPREFAVRVIAREVVPLGTPLVPRERAAGRPAWRVVALGLCLLTSGLALSLWLFRGTGATPSGPTAIVSTAIPPLPPRRPVPPAGFPTPP